MSNIPLKKLWLGKLDGKEIYFSPDEIKEGCMRTFVIPENVDLERIVSGESQFIIGNRGTGKTSLLGYLAHLLKGRQFSTQFLSFKSDIGEQNRMEMSRSALKDYVDSGQIAISQDFKDSWRFIFLHRIASHIHKDSRADHSQAKKLFELTGLEQNLFKKILGFFPKLSSGKVVLNSIGVELGVFSSGGTQREVKEYFLSDLCDAIEFELFKQKFKEHYVLVDELEIFHIDDEQYRRDLLMVRDLIFSANKLNRKFRERDFGCKIVCSVRNEVVQALSGDGQEVERLILDRAERLQWHSERVDDNHFLMKLVNEYLKYSLFRIGQELDFDDSDNLLQKYFPTRIQDVRIANYLIDRSFMRPRDIVARLTAAREISPNDMTFSQSALEKSENAYSKMMWTEVRYELSAIYDVDQLSKIETIFMAWRPSFGFSDFRKRIDDLSSRSASYKAFRQNIDASKLLQDLYRVGAIGNEWSENSRRKNRWIFRGEQNVILERNLTLNRALRAHFSLS